MSRHQNRSINVTAYAIALATAWTLLLVALAIWDVQHSLRHRKELILNEARANFFKDQAFRFWSAEHGGVYVPPSDHTPPNPYLDHVPNRDVVTTTGQRLTLVNPAYMVRQLMEDYEELYGIRGRITSKNPLRPENAPDPWERAALDSFERGATEIAQYSDINGQPYLRLMRPMIAEKACLKCHSQQGYKEGDIRGGVGVSVPAAAYLAQANETASERRIVLGFIWLAGLFAIWWVGRDVRQRVQEQELAENALRESERTKTTLISNLPGFAYRCANDPDWTMKYVSDGCKAVTGYDADDFLDNKTLAYNDIVHPDHQHTLWEEWQNIIERQGTFEAEYPIITASGETRWVWERGRGIYSDNGELQFLEGFITDITERRHAQESVRVMAEMLDNAPSSITVHDSEGRILYANQKTLDLHGYSGPELMALNLRDLDAPESQALIPDRIRAIARDGEAAFEVIHIRKDGSVFPLEVIAKSVNWLGKQAIMGVCTDITERRRELEIASARSRILLKAFEYTTGDLLQYVLNEAEALTQSSIGFFHFLEADQITLSPQAWSTRTVNEFCNAAGMGAHHPLGQAGVWADCIRERRPVVYNDYGSLPHRKGLPSGHAAVSRFVSIPVTRSDRIVAIIGVGNKTQDYTEADVETISRLADLCWDIIERKRVEESLRLVEERHWAVLQTAMDGFWLVDRDGRILQANDTYSQMTGYSIEELLSLSVHHLEAAETARESGEHIKRLIVEGSGHFETRHRRKDGSTFDVEVRVQFLPVEGGRMVAFMRDITERKTAERALKESETNFRMFFQSIDDMVAVVTHDGRILFANNAFTRKLGYTHEEFAQMRVLQLHPAELGKEATDIFISMLKHERATCPLPLLSRNGELVPVETRVSFGRWNGQECVFGISKDLSAEQEAQQRFERLFRNNPTLMALTDLDGLRFVDVNDAFLRTLGYSRDEVIGRTTEDLTLFVSPDQHKSAGRQLGINGRFSGVELQVRRKDGAILDGLFSGEVIRNQGREYFLTVMIDMTERKQMEQTLAVQHERFRGLFDESIAAIYVFDNEKRFVDSNQAGLELLGYSRAELLSMSIPDVDADPQIVLPAHTELLSGGRIINYEHRLLRKDGHIITVLNNSRALFNPHGNVIGMQSTLIDITERKRAEEQLRQSQTQYQDLFNSVMEGICVVDENEFIKYCNPAFVDIFDAACHDDLVGRNLLDFIVADHHQRVINQTAERRKGLSSHYEIDIVSLGGRKKTLLVSVSPRFDAQKNYCGAFGAAVDITETKRLQELESRAQRLETAGQIAGQVAHDFNNMLAPMMAYPELIREQLPTDSSGIKYLDAIEDSAQRIADLNQQLLTLSRRGHYNQEILNLNNIVRHVVRDMGELPDSLVIETNLANDLMNIKGGVAQLHRVIMNLVVNARDAVRDVGKISIRTENYYVDDTTICYGRIPRGEFAKITISDTGCGIPDEVLQKIFDPFFTTKSSDKKRGSGLGLSVVDAVMKDHNGYIDLSTSIGAGTTFYLYFPITRAAISERETEEIPRGEETVLIVDDDEIQREVSARLLTTLGYRVTVCDSGRKAIELLQKKMFDILILDMIMPSDLDGTEVFRQALHIRPDQKAIIVSGFSESDRVAEAQRLGAGAFVKKPLNRTVIALAVRRELDRIPAKSPRPASVG